MELRQLRHLLALDRHRNYARAADALGLTQSALTQSIARLETDLALRLFDRGRFGAVPTPAGELLIHRAQLIESEERMARQDLEAFKGASRGDITIGVGKSVVQQLVPIALARFARRRPDVVVTAHEGWSTDLYEGVLNGSLDFAVSAAMPDIAVDAELAQDLLFIQHEAVVIGAEHPLASLIEPTMADLVDQHWVVPPAGSGRVRKLQDMFRNEGLAPPTRFTRTDSIGVLVGLVSAGAAIGWATIELMPSGAHVGHRQLNFPMLTEERRACITYRRRSRLQPLASALSAVIKSVAAESRS